MTELHHWQEWHRECALARCDLGTRNALTTFVNHRFRGCLQDIGNFLKLKLAYDPEKRPPKVEETWQEFELDAVKDLVAKRSAKDYLMECAAEGGVNYVQAMATLRVRETVRRWLVFEVQRQNLVSLEVPVGEGKDPSRTVGAIVEAGSEIDESVARDFQEAAEWVIIKIGDQITNGHRIALALMGAEIPFSWPEAETFSGRSNTTLATNRDDFGKMVKRWIEDNAEFRDDTPEARRTLTGVVIAQVAREAFKERERELRELAIAAERRLRGALKKSSGNGDGSRL